ncbi:MAG: fibronectin type III domain-containing protein [Gammaproteobacteria bacterium]|nr:fibronectin type III domain-containing protein [Gammaproteobacteria bacterium]MDH3412107.1 fibronectin type III domain-containing protein [Gammaproteobacteria bacterium]
MLRTSRTFLLVPVFALVLAACGSGGGDAPAALAATGGGSPDTTAPTTPTTLTASAAGSTAIDLSWQSSSDNVGVTGYRVERCQGTNCSTFAQIATPTGTSLTDTGLTAAMSYSYRTRATDAAGNLSGFSPIAIAATQGASGVTVSLAANPTSVTSGGSSTLTWSSTNTTSCTASGAWSGSMAISGSQSTGALTTSSSYTLTCTGSGGSASASATVTVSAAGSQNFATRCAQPGVIKCVAFDAASDLTGTYGDNSGTLSGAATPMIDTSVKASGAGSLKFTIPSNSPADSSGSYFTNFSSNLLTQFGENSEFYIQWRQRFSPEFLNTVYAGGGGWKHLIIGAGDKPGCTASTSANGLCYSSCTALETVVQNTDQKGFAQMYNSCTGSNSHGAFDGFYERFGAFDFKLQNARPNPYCLYSQSSTGYFPPAGNCFGYFPDEWMTFQVRIKTGPRVGDEWTNSFVSLWIARANQPSELVINWGPYNLSAWTASADLKFGKVWLLPYHTGKDPSQAHPTGFTWYDELIVSTTPIADPL